MGRFRQQLYGFGSTVIRKLRELDTSTDLEAYFEDYPRESVERRLFFNIGSGPFRHPAWAGLDADPAYRNGKLSRLPGYLYYDLFDHQALPADDGSLELIYTSHTIEHIDNDSVQHLFNEAYRSLKPGGVIRIVTPDILLAYGAWRRNDQKFFFWVFLPVYSNNHTNHCLKVPLAQASIHQVFLEDFASQAAEIAVTGAPERISDQRLSEIFNTLPLDQALNYCTSFCTVAIQQQHPFRHMNWFHEEKLKGMLQKSGFRHICRSGYLQSAVPVWRNLKYFDNTLPQLSLFMEAVR